MTRVHDLIHSGRRIRTLRLSLLYQFVLLLVWLATQTASAQPVTILREFGDTNNLGSKVYAPLLVTADGWLFGSALEGGPGGCIFKVRPDGTGYQVLHIFGLTPEDGMSPNGLIEWQDGYVYGTTTYSVDASAGGKLFRIAKDGSGYEILAKFEDSTFGFFPQAGLVKGPDGRLFGTSALSPQSGNYNAGVLFEVLAQGTDIAVVPLWPNSAEVLYQDLPAPLQCGAAATLAFDGTNTFFGTTLCTGADGSGTVYQATVDGEGTNLFAVKDLTVAAPAGPPNFPAGGLAISSSGWVYGTTKLGGFSDPGSQEERGTFFRFQSTAPTNREAKPFGTASSPFSIVPVQPAGQLLATSNGVFGTSLKGGVDDAGTVFKIGEAKFDFTITHSFRLNDIGAAPAAGLVDGGNGLLYGTTTQPGSRYFGSIYSLNSTNGVVQLVRPLWQAGGDGANPTAALAEDDNWLYGVAPVGGQFGFGRAFRVKRDGTGYAALHDFGDPSSSVPAEAGYSPVGGLLLASDGMLYGTAVNRASSRLNGLLFRLSTVPGGEFKVMVDFMPLTTGAPTGNLVEGPDGALYGTCNEGGDTFSGCVFVFPPKAGTARILYSFGGRPDGAKPSAGLLLSSAGVLFGVTLAGGNNDVGTIFRIKPDGTGYQRIFDFTNNVSGSQFPLPALVEYGGRIYGSTGGGGNQSCCDSTGIGTVFSLNPDGSAYENLWTFGDGSPAQDLAYPSRLTVGANDGFLYGAAYPQHSAQLALFRIDPNRSTLSNRLEVLAQAPSGPAAPTNPPTPLLLSRVDHALYGTTTTGGRSDAGQLFRLPLDSSTASTRGLHLEKDLYSIEEGNGSLGIKVVLDDPAPSNVSVQWEAIQASAAAGIDFFNITDPLAAIRGTLTFLPGVQEQVIQIGIATNSIPKPPVTFEVQLDLPQGERLASPQVATVTIVNHNTSQSRLDLRPPDPLPQNMGSLRVLLDPSNGAWRLPFEQYWHASGETITGLVPDSYAVQFQPVPGFARGPLPVSVGSLQQVTTNAVYLADPSLQSAALQVNLVVSPPPLAGSNPGWRLAGERQWHASGQALTDLATSTATNLAYSVEFRVIPGQAALEPLLVSLVPGQTNLITGFYTNVVDLPPATALSASPVKGGLQGILNGLAASANVRLPHPLAGQLRTPIGYGSGIAVRDHVVLTAAHVLFDPATSNFVSEVLWFPSREAGAYEPHPLRAKGWCVFREYLSQRQLEGETVSAKELDVAAIYFDSAVAANGQSGYLVSTNRGQSEWLLGPYPKLLIGYPLDTGNNGANDGLMHDVIPDTYGFSPQTGTESLYLNNHAPVFTSSPGNSGGPVCVSLNAPGDSKPTFYPAGVYLGASGGFSQVRVIDPDAADLINQAESAAAVGQDFGGNVGFPAISYAPRADGNPNPVLRIFLKTGGVESTNATWTIAGRPNQMKSGQLVELLNTRYLISFSSLPGYLPPTSGTYYLNPGVTNTLSLYYVPQVSVNLDSLGKALLTWPGSATQAGYVLETADAITGPWAAQPVPLRDAGNLDLVPSAQTRYFRLHYPVPP